LKRRRSKKSQRKNMSKELPLKRLLLEPKRQKKIRKIAKSKNLKRPRLKLRLTRSLYKSMSKLQISCRTLWGV
jgi:hypothetical protein